MSKDEGFTINKDYADKYNLWREKEELQRLKDKYGDVHHDDQDSSSSESEDEEGEALTAKKEKNWLRALSALKSKDPKIYDKSVDFFKEDSNSDNSEDSSDQEKEPKLKPMFLKDYDREVILQKDGVIESEDSDEEEEKELLATSQPGYFEEQALIKKSFKSDVASDESGSEEDFLTRRKKTTEEEKKEEEEYIDWLKGQKDNLSGGDTDIGIELNPLKSYWTNPKLESGEQFLRDYILNKRYKEDEDSAIPSYEEIVGGDEDLSEDDNTLDKQETFERKYNFRYEEPDEEFIKNYPRTIGESVRKKDNKRAEKRREVKERKLREKEKKKEELKQLKNLKRKEIMTKLETLKEITGNATLGLTEDDIEDEFDPKKHDQMMQKAFDQDYYDMDVDADGKPVFSSMDDDDEYEEDWDNWAGPSGEGQEYEAYCEDEDFNMDADYDPSQPQAKGRAQGLDDKSKKKRRSKFSLVVDTKKPVFDPTDKTFEEYFDEYYKLDYEDVIGGDLPCRFKYRQVSANDFGLSTEEVMTAKDKELNAWVSLKKMSMYRTEEEELFEKKIFQKKGRNQSKKLNILPSLVDDSEDMEDQPEKEDVEVGEVSKPSTSGTSSNDSKKKKKKKKKKRHVSVVVDTSPHVPKKGPVIKNKGKRPLHLGNVSEKGFKKMKVDNASQSKLPQGTFSQNLKTQQQTETAKKKQKRKTKKPVMSDERLKAYGIDPRKYKYTQGKKSTN